MKDNCPHCGAAITTEKCPYCGTMFFDFACLDLKNPFYIKFKNGSKIQRCKVRLTSLTFRTCPSSSCLYADNSVYYESVNPPDRTITLDMQVIQDGKLISQIVDTDLVTDPVTDWVKGDEIT